MANTKRNAQRNRVQVIRHSTPQRTSPPLPHIDFREVAAFDTMFQGKGMSPEWGDRLWDMYQNLRTVRDPRHRIDSILSLAGIVTRIRLAAE